MEDIIMKRLEAECFGPRTIEIYGGAYHLAVQGKENLNDIAIGIIGAIGNAKYWAPNTDPDTIAANYCSLFFVDLMLMQVYLNIVG